MSITKNDGWEMMTYGVLPSLGKFEKHYDAEVGITNSYETHWSLSDARTVRNTILEGGGSFSADEIYKALKQLVDRWEKGDDNAGDIASSILSTLKFEWI